LGAPWAPKPMRKRKRENRKSGRIRGQSRQPPPRPTRFVLTAPLGPSTYFSDPVHLSTRPARRRPNMACGPRSARNKKITAAREEGRGVSALLSTGRPNRCYKSDFAERDPPFPFNKALISALNNSSKLSARLALSSAWPTNVNAGRLPSLRRWQPALFLPTIAITVRAPRKVPISPTFFFLAWSNFLWA